LKILFLIRTLQYAGAERQLVTLARGLRQRGHAVTVAVFYAGGPLEEELRKIGVPVRSIQKRGRWDMLGFLWRLIKLVRRESPDVLHGYLSISNIVTALIGIVFPRIRVVWGIRSSNMQLDEYDWLTRVSYRIESQLSRLADLIIANSYAGLRYAVSKGFAGEKLIVIQNGIDTDLFRPDPRARQRLRAEWGINEDQVLIGMVARVDPMKDHATFLQSAALLAKEDKRFVFACVGRSRESEKQKLVALSKQLGLAGRLIWSDARADMPAVYSALDLLVSSSFGEGFSNVIAEAMACDVPCVATDVGDSAIIVGTKGEVIPPRDAGAMKAAITKCVRKSRVSSEQQPRRQQIIDRFSVMALEARTEEALLNLFKSIA
jgi:glycosyltransferase involved in cell wall biosynthesis